MSKYFSCLNDMFVAGDHCDKRPKSIEFTSTENNRVKRVRLGQLTNRLKQCYTPIPLIST